MRYMVERNFVNVVGEIWWPMGVPCAMSYTLSAYDVENIGEFTRENVDRWLATHAGDFSSITDFEATVGDQWIDWANPESEFTFSDCMNPVES